MNKPGTLLRDAWESYRRELLEPIHAGPTQVAETRLAFYAGAKLVLGLLHAIADDVYTEGEACILMSGVNGEMEEFRREIMAKADRFLASHPRGEAP
jgi:hypothetical protein